MQPPRQPRAPLIDCSFLHQAIHERTRARLGFLAEAARASERAAELARIRFREGVADFLSVLDAERSLLDAQNQLTAARVDAALSLVDVYQATGQGLAAGEVAER